DDDLEHAGALFAQAVMLAGVAAVSAVLLRGGVKAVRNSRPAAVPAPKSTTPPPAPRPQWGENFEITPVRPDRVRPGPTSALTASAREALSRPNTLLIRSVGGEWSAAGTNATAGASWWRSVDMSLARPILDGLRSGRPGPTVQSSIGRYGFRPGSPNTAEVWVTDLHTLLSRNPGATVAIDAAGDVVFTTAEPNAMLYGIRRFRFDRRNPVQSYWELF
ncbi:MAG TPA: hypothetical protein VFG69_16355, partial [Nannocystaceae bacterium]|nr:hypothetical protein [Nannocystaceae bacterium]